jgi:hypothetical protein
LNSAFSQPSPQKSDTRARPVALGDLALADLPHVLDQRVVLELHALRGDVEPEV